MKLGTQSKASALIWMSSTAFLTAVFTYTSALAMPGLDQKHIPVELKPRSSPKKIGCANQKFPLASEFED